MSAASINHSQLARNLATKDQVTGRVVFVNRVSQIIFCQQLDTPVKAWIIQLALRPTFLK